MNPLDEITCLASVEDVEGEIAETSASVMIDNRPPEVSVPIISPTEVMVGDTAECTFLASDVDEQELDITTTWYAGSDEIGSGTSLVLSSENVSANDVLTCRVDVSDGVDSVSETSFPVVVGGFTNTPPSEPNISISPVAPMAGEDDLVCFGESTDVDGDTLSYTYTWSSGVGASIEGDTVPAGDTSGGETWTCTVEVSDGTDSANASESIYVDSDPVLLFDDFNDGDFTNNPTWNEINNDDAPGTISVVNNELKILRSVSGGNGGSVGIDLETPFPVTSTTTISFDVKATYSNVGSGCGWTCGEYPINIRLYIDLADGTPSSFNIPTIIVVVLTKWSPISSAMALVLLHRTHG